MNRKFDSTTLQVIAEHAVPGTLGHEFLVKTYQLEKDIERKRKGNMYRPEYLQEYKAEKVAELVAEHHAAIAKKKADAEKIIEKLKQKYEGEDTTGSLLRFERMKAQLVAKSPDELAQEAHAYEISNEKEDLDKLTLLRAELSRRGMSDKAGILYSQMQRKNNTEPWHIDPEADEVIKYMEFWGKPLKDGYIRIAIRDNDEDTNITYQDRDADTLVKE